MCDMWAGVSGRLHLRLGAQLQHHAGERRACAGTCPSHHSIFFREEFWRVRWRFADGMEQHRAYQVDQGQGAAAVRSTESTKQVEGDDDVTRGDGRRQRGLFRCVLHG